jgi:hypothetical protein
MESRRAMRTFIVLFATLLGACTHQASPETLPRIYYCGTAHVAEPDPVAARACVVADNYDGVLIRYMRTGSVHAVASELGMTDADVKALITEAMHRLYRRIWRA